VAGGNRAESAWEAPIPNRKALQRVFLRHSCDVVFPEWDNKTDFRQNRHVMDSFQCSVPDTQGNVRKQDSHLPSKETRKRDSHICGIKVRFDKIGNGIFEFPGRHKDGHSFG